MTDSRLLYQGADEFGPITVSEEDGYCTLSFALGDEQSRCLKTAPHILQYEYTQAMLLALLFCQPKRILVLGLGGGSLVTSLLHHLPGVHITAIELRPQVVELAYRYFRLPRSKRLEIIQQDANLYLRSGVGRTVDLVFADLYHAQGVDAAQLQAEFIAHCAARLKTNGWLVLNCWLEHRANPDFLDALQQHFADIRTVLTGSLNWVILAGKIPDTQTANHLKQSAADLSTPLGFTLTRHLARLRPLEA